MKRYFLLLNILCLVCSSYAQYFRRDTICGTDTVHVNYRSLMDRERIKYDAFNCTRISKFGFRFEWGFGRYSYNTRTKSWLGNHGGALLGIAFAHEKFNLGFRFKPWTVNPGTELTFNGDVLPKNADVNPVKLDFYLSYSFDLKHNFSFEPYLGFSRSLFIVINEDSLKKSFNIPKASGITTGITLNKYFRIKEHHFIALFVNGDYGYANYKKVHPNLDNGYLNWSIGLAYKGFYKREFLKRIN